MREMKFGLRPPSASPAKTPAAFGSPTRSSHRLRASFASVTMVVVCAATIPARATCGSAACFLETGGGEGLPVEGSLRLDLSFRYVDQSRMLAGSHGTSEVLTPKIDFEERRIEPDHHREIRTLNTAVQLDLTYGLGRRWGLLASLPIYTERDHEHFDDVGTPDEHFTNSDGTRGFGDVQLGAARAFVLKDRDLLQGALRLKLPTGAWKLRDGEGAINEPTIQPGTGSYDVIASLHYSHLGEPGAFDWFASGSRRINGENGLDYRQGSETILNVGGSHPAGGRITWVVQINGRRTGHDRYRGSSVRSTGGRLVDITPGLRIVSASATTLYGYVQIPVLEHVNEGQLAPRWGFVVGVSRTF